MDAPETRYVERPDGVSIAYQVFGDGPRDLMYVPGFISHLDLAWTDPGMTRFYGRLAGLARVIVFDKPGTGVSDPIPHVPTLEERIEDVRIVLDAAGSERAVLLGFSEGGATCVTFAATWPERVDALVLYGALCTSHPSAEDLAAWGLPVDFAEEKWTRMDAATRAWGSGASVELLAPTLAGRVERRLWALFERAAASPRMARALVEAAKLIDVTAVAPHVAAPTLVLHRTDDFTPVESGRRLAALIPGAHWVELPGQDHAFWVGDVDLVTDEIESFLTGARRQASRDRLLATVVFTDIVGSTGVAARLGDARWRTLLERYDDAVRRHVSEHGGRVVHRMGDGHLSLFTGPGRAVECAVLLREVARELDLRVRSGLHTGECDAMGDDVGGLAVHIGARVSALADPEEVLVSGTVRDLLVGSPLRFTDRGEHELRGVPGRWRVHRVEDGTQQRPEIEAARELRPGDRALLQLARNRPRAVRRAAALARRVGSRVS